MGQSKPFARSIVLVVEDDEDQRSLAATVFEEAGFNVIECASAEAGAAVIDAKRGEIAMIFTDLRLPGRMDGVELAHIAKTKTPTVPVIVTSGGILGKLTKVSDTEVEVEIAQGVKVRVVKSMISQVLTKNAKPAND